MKIIVIMVFALLALLMQACTMPLVSEPTATRLPTLTQAGPQQPGQPAEATMTTEPAASQTPEPTFTTEPSQTPEPTDTSSPVPSPTVFAPFNARVWANNVNLRTNPGYLFSVARVLEEGAEFTVLGISPGGEWLFVRRPDNVSGWVFGMLVDSEYELENLPVIQPTDVQTITGRLLTTGGEPVNGVQFMITKGSDINGQRNDASTDSNGEFIAFMPLSASGEWTVSYTAISCQSIVMDADCNTLPAYYGNPQPESQVVTLPNAEPLTFEWK